MGFGAPPGGNRRSNTGRGNDNIFQESYIAYPFAFGRTDLENGNKIILPPSSLDTLTRLSISYPMMFKVVEPQRNMYTCVGVQEFIAEEGTC